jgi:5-methylcytosine-specific restriction protein A
VLAEARCSCAETGVLYPVPNSPLVECSYPGCTTLVVKGRCIRHPFRPFESARKTGRALYDSKEWRHARVNYLDQNPLCATPACKVRGVRAREVDHIVPHRGDEELFWCYENLQGLCTPCHNKKTATEIRERHVTNKGVR